MKKNYTIKEISNLFDIGSDSLRYYEKIGLLQPKRGENNYRLYSLNEIYQLNIIADLRKLHFSLPQIKKYLKDLSLKNTINLLGEEKEVIIKEIHRLEEQTRLIDMQKKQLTVYQEMETNTFSVKEFPKRYYIELKTDIRLDEEVDISIRMLQKEYGFSMHQFESNKIGASLLKKELKEESIGNYRSVFMLQDEKINGDQKILMQGKYLCYTYKGSYRKLPLYIEELLSYAKEKGLLLDDIIYEFYLIDNRYTAIVEEYLTQVQVRILNDEA